MKSYPRILMTVMILLSFMLVSHTGLSQSYNLTGAWKDNNGTLYCFRQVDDELFWDMDGRPTVHNVYHGTIAGNYVTGKWADLPGAQMSGSGSLALLIQSSDQIVKVGQSDNYGASTWTRADDSLCAACTTSSQGSPGGGPNTTGGITTTGSGISAGHQQPTDCPCGLGSKWEITYQLGNYWGATLTRRNNSNIFDMNARTAAAGYKLVVNLNVNGTHVEGSGTDQKGTPVITSWTGTIGDKVNCDANLCCTVSGSWQQTTWPFTVNYKGKIFCGGTR